MSLWVNRRLGWKVESGSKREAKLLPGKSYNVCQDTERTSERAQQVVALAAMPGDLSSRPRTHMAEEGNQLPQVVL